MASDRRPSAAASAAGRALNAARTRKLTPERRAELSRQAAKARWQKVREAKAAAEPQVV